MGNFQIRVIILCFAVSMLDGFDTQSIAFVAPALKKIWSIPSDTLGVLFSASLLGTILGASLLGALADRLGRKTIIAISVLSFGAMSFLSATASSTNVLLIYRFLTGLGLGGAIPNIIALTSEYTPERNRTTAVAVMFAGFPLGAIFGGIISAQLITSYGWPSVFLLGGILPLILLPILLFWLPESVRYLAIKRQETKKITRIMERISPGVNWIIPVATSQEKAIRKHYRVVSLFTDGRARWTLLLWTVIFLSLLLTYFLVNWIPSLLADAGLSHKSAIMGIVVLNFGGIVGSAVVGRLCDRHGQFLPLIAGYGMGSIAVASIGVTTYSVPVLMSVIFAAGFCIVGSQLALAELSAKHYPTYIRSTGVGWAMGFGRTGSAVGPVIGGMLLTYGFGRVPLFLTAALIAILAAITIFTMSFNIPPRKP